MPDSKAAARDIVVLVDGFPPFTPLGDLAERLIRLAERLLQEPKIATSVASRGPQGNPSLEVGLHL